MTEVQRESVFDDITSRKSEKLGASALEAAREYTAVALDKPPIQVSLGEIAVEFARVGFNEWPADVAAEVRDRLATEYGFTHI